MPLGTAASEACTTELAAIMAGITPDAKVTLLLWLRVCMPAPACETLYSPPCVASRLPLAAVEDGEDAIATCRNLELAVSEVADDERAIADCLAPALAASAGEGGENAVDDRR